jgi:hypothetical protein
VFLNNKNIPHNKHFDGTPNICDAARVHCTQPELSFERKRHMHLVGERQRWTIGKRQKCATEIFLILCVRFHHRLLHGWFGANRKKLKKRKGIFFLSRYMVPVLISKGVFFF